MADSGNTGRATAVPRGDGPPMASATEATIVVLTSFLGALPPAASSSGGLAKGSLKAYRSRGAVKSVNDVRALGDARGGRLCTAECWKKEPNVLPPRTPAPARVARRGWPPKILRSLSYALPPRARDQPFDPSKARPSLEQHRVSLAALSRRRSVRRSGAPSPGTARTRPARRGCGLYPFRAPRAWQRWHFLATRRGAHGVKSLCIPRPRGVAGIALPRHQRGGA